MCLVHLDLKSYCICHDAVKLSPHGRDCGRVLADRCVQADVPLPSLLFWFYCVASHV